LAFIVLSIIGATTATIFLKRLLIFPYFFQILVALSFALATVSALFYLKRIGLLSLTGARKKWRYLATLYGMTLVVNLLFFMIIFPWLANFNQKGEQAKVLSQGNYASLITLRVDIPCPGHATLIMDELKKTQGVLNVNFKFPNLFEVVYDQGRISPLKILELQIFKQYKASIL